MWHAEVPGPPPPAVAREPCGHVAREPCGQGAMWPHVANTHTGGQRRAVDIRSGGGGGGSPTSCQAANSAAHRERARLVSFCCSRSTRCGRDNGGMAAGVARQAGGWLRGPGVGHQGERRQGEGTRERAGRGGAHVEGPPEAGAPHSSIQIRSIQRQASAAAHQTHDAHQHRPRDCVCSHCWPARRAAPGGAQGR